MNRFRAAREFWKTWRDGEYLGDAVILKVAAFGGFEPSERAVRLLRDMPRRAPDFSGHDFSSFGPGTLGREYAAFMERHGLEVFRFSGGYQDLLEKHFLAVWYAAVHDLVHVLTGHAPTWVGEAGVWAFVAGQGLSPQADRAVGLARFLYPLLSPGKGSAVRAAIREGIEMGRKADPILAIDFHGELSRPLAEVRRRHHIAPTTVTA